MRLQSKHLIIESKLDYIESNLQFKDLTFKAIVPKLDYIDSKLEYYDLSLQPLVQLVQSTVFVFESVYCFIEFLELIL